MSTFSQNLLLLPCQLEDKRLAYFSLPPSGMNWLHYPIKFFQVIGIDLSMNIPIYQ